MQQLYYTLKALDSLEVGCHFPYRLSKNLQRIKFKNFYLIKGTLKNFMNKELSTVNLTSVTCMQLCHHALSPKVFIFSSFPLQEKNGI